jgi:hypothetical protein
LEWFQQMRSEKVPVDDLSRQKTSINVMRQWKLHRFMTRHDVGYKTLSS